MKRWWIGVAALAVVLASLRAMPAQPGPAAIRAADLQEYLTYLASDELLGREVFTEGYGVAAQYIADHLRQFGVKPLGDHGSYFQMVRYNDVRILSDRSSITVSVNGQTRTFKNGEGVVFAAPAGGKQRLTFAGAEFLGYGLPLKGRDDYAGRDVKGKLVLWLGETPRDMPATAGQIAEGRARHALDEEFAGASIAYEAGGVSAPPVDRPATNARPRTMGDRPTVILGDFQTTEKFDRLRAPDVTADDRFFEFLFSGQPGGFARLKDANARRAAAEGFTLPGVSVTFDIDTSYQVLSTVYTRNVVGMVEGADPALKDTYVMFGAHLDHVGYFSGAGGEVPGPVGNPLATDKIWNGADDDGSGTVSVMAIAKAFATGPKPGRSVVFIWHAGEEPGLFGSLYNADFPVVPLDKVQCELNIDMIGRDRDDNSRYGNTVFVVGADRISTDLHNEIVNVNDRLTRPLALDYELNDPADPEAFYYRSDHYSYAAKGVPIAFFFTGTHPDYHRNSDSVDKIHFDKMAHVAQLIYQTGLDIASRRAPLARDNRGPRAGKGFNGTIK